jgi:hypothetical protein
VADACGTSYSGSKRRRIIVQDLLGKSERSYLKNKLKAKRLRAWLER